MDIDMEQVRKATLKVISKVVKEGKLEENTQKAIRRKVEDALGLDTGALDEQEYKDVVKDVVQDYIANHDEGGPDEDGDDAPKKGKGKKAQSSSTAESKPTKPRKPRASAPKAKSEETPSKKTQKGKKPARSASVVPTSDEEAEVKSAASKPKPAKKNAKAKRVDSDDEVSGAHSSPKPPAKRQKTVTPSKDEEPVAVRASSSSPAPAPQGESQPERSENQRDGEKSESEMSVLEDDDPPARKPKQKGDKNGGSSRGDKGTKGRKRKEPAKELSKDEETIKRLKSFVVACGVRKVWSKEFKGLDRPSDQIRRLRQILADLGMTGRMSMEQAKAIKEKREFAQELEDVQDFAQKMEAAGRRRAQISPAADEAPLEDSDVEAVPKRRRVTARQSIMAFLGDEDESE